MQPRHIFIIRKTLIIVFVVFLTAVVYSYYRRSGKPVEKVSSQKILASGITRATEGVEFTEHHEGRELFKVKALRLIERRGGKNNLQSIEVYNFGKDGTRSDMIRSDYCEYSQSDNNVVFKGNVFVRVDGGTEIRCNSLQYDKATETVSTSEPFTLVNKGLEGTGKGLTYSFSAQSFTIHETPNFTLRTAEPAGPSPSAMQIRARTSLYARSNHLLKLSGDAEIAQETAKLKGQTIAVNFSTDDSELEYLEATGGASYNRAVDTTRTRLQGDRIKIHFARGTNAIEKIETYEKSDFSSQDSQRQTQLTAKHIVIDFAQNQPSILKAYTEAELKSFSRENSLEIKGESIMATFQQQGYESLDKLSVEKNAKLRSLNSGQSSDQMQAEKIDIRFSDSSRGTAMKDMLATGDVVWQLSDEPAKKGTDQNLRLLKCDNLKIDYQANGVNPRELLARGRCLLEMTSQRNSTREQKTITADQFHIVFHPAGHQIDRFLAERHVKVITGITDKNNVGTRVSQSHKLIARFNKSEEIESLEQIGNFMYSEGDRRGESERAYYEEASGLLHLTGKPVVWDEESRTYAREITFDRKNKNLLANGNVKTIYKSKGPNAVATPFSTGGKEPVVITSNRLEFHELEKTSFYIGNARALQEGNFIQAETIEVSNLKQQFIAQKSVYSLFNFQRGQNNAYSKQSVTPTLVKADRMIYTQGKETVRYEKNVSLKSDATDMKADAMDMILDKERNHVEKAILNGHIHIVQPEREGTGTQAEYYAVEDKIVLMGNLAEVVSKTKGKSSGKRLTFYSKGDRISVESQ